MSRELRALIERWRGVTVGESSHGNLRPLTATEVDVAHICADELEAALAAAEDAPPAGTLSEFERGALSRFEWTDALHATYFALFKKQAPESMKPCDISHAIVDYALAAQPPQAPRIAIETTCLQEYLNEQRAAAEQRGYERGLAAAPQAPKEPGAPLDVRNLDGIEMLDHCRECGRDFVAYLHIRHSDTCYLNRPPFKRTSFWQWLRRKLQRERETPHE